jgi:DNA-binding CsgD family transcriptional regulator
LQRERDQHKMAGLIQLSDNQKSRREGEVILKYMESKMRNNKNFLSVITGSTGSGKSYSCLRLAELWYDYYFKGRKFPVENICFSVEDLIRRLRNGKLKKGDLLIAEEIGVSANAKNFQSKTNKALQYILQSFRSLNILVLFNVPHFSFFDKTARMLMHSHIQTLKIDQQKEICILKPYFLSISQSTGKIYTKWMRVRSLKTGQIIKITRLNLHKPSEELIKPYEDMKERFVKTLIINLDDQQAEDNIKTQQRRHKLRALTPRQVEVFEYLNEGKTTGEIARLMDLPNPTISKQKNFIKKKGYIWKEPKRAEKREEIEENA